MKKEVQQLKRIAELETVIAELQKLIEEQDKLVADIPLLKTRLETLEIKDAVKEVVIK